MNEVKIIKENIVFNYRNKNEKRIFVFVNGERICVLDKIHKAVKEGHDSRSKFRIDHYENSLNLKYYQNESRSIKQIVEYFSKSK